MTEPTTRILQGHVLNRLIELPNESVHCVITSPPYWGLRDYGTESQYWGNGWIGSLGLEPTPEDYVKHLVEVFRAVRRVLRNDGTLWLNLGDSYANTGGMTGGTKSKDGGAARTARMFKGGYRSLTDGLKPKDLVGIPWSVAFALRADGWYLRSDIIWEKPNAMPESIKDRPTKSHEYLFLFAKGSWVTRGVHLSDLSDESFHLGDNARLKSADMGARDLCIAFSSAILDAPESKKYLGLSLLNSQERQQGSGDVDGYSVGDLPVGHRAALLAARFRLVDAAPKRFLEELHRLGVALADGDHLLIGGGAAKYALPPSVHRYGDTAVAIHNSGQVCKYDLVSHEFSISRPSHTAYYYDHEAIEEPAVSDHPSGNGYKRPEQLSRGGRGSDEPWQPRATRNRRTVWTIPTEAFPEAHFATFPKKLVEPCLLAGCPKDGTVLDPFGGSGTVGVVAAQHGRRAILIELNPSYVAMAERRQQGVQRKLI